MNGIGVAGEVVTAGTALAGLILVYIGSVITSYGSYDAAAQKSVRDALRARAWLAFVGLFLALLAAGLGVIGKWLNIECAGSASVWVLLAAFGWTVFVIVSAIREIK